MSDEIQIRFVLVEPLAGIDSGIQKGKGKDYETFDTQRSTGRNLTFSFRLPVKQKDSASHFSGPIVQGPLAKPAPTMAQGWMFGSKFAGRTNGDDPTDRRLERR